MTASDMTDQEIIDVVTAHRDGKAIQYQDSGAWYDAPHPGWDFLLMTYRVKPEPPKPREWCITLKPGGGMCGHLIDSSNFYHKAGCNVHVREVLE